MVDQGYCEGKAMRMIRLRRELGVNSDVMAKVIYRLKVKTCFHVGINIEGGVSSPGPGLALRMALGDVDADVVWVDPGLSASFEVLSGFRRH
ncbi:Tudor Domain-Containing Protein 6 [Manis pentadactyla]|nr:Tudor Domain-Containing Protein 6 [Manis pentadactyla]